MNRGKHNRPVSCPVLALITSISRTDRRLTLDRLFHILEPFAHSVPLVREKCDERRNKRVSPWRRVSFRRSSFHIGQLRAKNSLVSLRFDSPNDIDGDIENEFVRSFSRLVRSRENFATTPILERTCVSSRRVAEHRERGARKMLRSRRDSDFFRPSDQKRRLLKIFRA